MTRIDRASCGCLWICVSTACLQALGNRHITNKGSHSENAKIRVHVVAEKSSLVQGNHKVFIRVAYSCKETCVFAPIERCHPTIEQPPFIYPTRIKECSVTGQIMQTLSSFSWQKKLSRRSTMPYISIVQHFPVLPTCTGPFPYWHSI